MPYLRKRHKGAKSQRKNGILHDDATPPARDNSIRQQERSLVKRPVNPSIPRGELTSRRELGAVLADLLAQCSASDAAAALIPWFCDALPSPKSRKEYFADLRRFLAHMVDLGVHPYSVTGDHVRMYKEALVQSGKRPASVARALSVIRGTYEQLGKKTLVPWDVVGDIQAVSAPRVTKNTTPMIGEADACRMLHAPDSNTPIGCRDHALLFTYFKTACRSRAVANAKVGDLERSDHEWHLRVTEKGNNERRLPLLEAAPAVLRWLEVVGIPLHDVDSPLFPAFATDKRMRPIRHPSIHLSLGHTNCQHRYGQTGL